MIQMFDAMLSALPDHAYYEKLDLGSSIQDSLLTAELPFGCFIHGAKLWNVSDNPEYPVYSICKTNTVDNTDFIPYRNAALVLSSIETGELIIKPMREDEGKMPLADPPAPNPPRPGIPRAKTYGVLDTWRTISSSDLGGAKGVFQAFLNAGNFQSAPYQFQVVFPGTSTKPSPFESLLSHDAGLKPQDPKQLRVDFHPLRDNKPPDSFGLGYQLGKPSMHDSRMKMPLEATFRFRGYWKDGWARLPLHILVSEVGSFEPDDKIVWLPRNKLKFEDGIYSGRFTIDLADLFAMAPGEKPGLPTAAWISFVHRDWQGPIERIEFPKRP